ncbi:MAG: ribonuclease E/G [Proteobacteria bacterium]|nr:ribonuclease E/G [Pseudomonadota bacterium]
MNGLDLLADEIDGFLYVAIVRNGTLVDLYVDRPDMTASWASLYLGKVIKIDTKLDAAFVDIGQGLIGYLPAKHVRHPGADVSETRTGITELLKGGQMVLVQIKSEGKRQTENENHKLPRLTMKLYVPGLFVAYSPYSSQVTISRKIKNEGVLTLTAKLKGKGGWLVQHSAEDAAEADIAYESKSLQEKWQQYLSAEELAQGQPALLISGPDAIFRALVDYGALNFEHIYVGNKRLLELVIGWCKEHLPALATSKRLRLFRPEQNSQRLFETYDLYSEIESLPERRVYLQGGGTIIIEHTSAVTVIDVNQGSAGSISEVNQSAVKEIARQIRLRALSGAILIDFINMEQKNERVRLLEAMESILADDAGNAQVHGFTRLGIMEITRKRRSAMLMEKLIK